MDSKKGGGKRQNRNEKTKLTLQLQQQMALASQMGIPPGFLDPTILQGAAGYIHPGQMDPQQLLGLQMAASGGLPMMDPAFAMQAYGSMSGFPQAGFPHGLMPGNMLAPGGAEWLAMMQQTQLIAAMGGLHQGIPPNYGGNPFSSPSLTQTAFQPSKMKGESRDISTAHKTVSTWSPVEGGISGGSRPSSAASSSQITAGAVSPAVSNQSRSKKYQPSPKQNSNQNFSRDVVSKALSHQQEALEINQANAKKIMQAELMQQFEHQFLLQQLQLQQQQDQIQTALNALKNPATVKGKSSQSEKLQQQLSQSIYEQLVASNGNLQPGTSNQQISALETLMSLGQLPIAGVSNLHEKDKSYIPQSSNHSFSPPSVQPSSRPNERRSRDTPSNDSTKNRNHIPSTSTQSNGEFLATLYSSMQIPGSSGSSKLPNKIENHQQQKANEQTLSGNMSCDYKPHHRRKQANPTSTANFEANSLIDFSKRIGIPDKTSESKHLDIDESRHCVTSKPKVKIEALDDSAGFDLSNKSGKSTFSNLKDEKINKKPESSEINDKDLIAAIQLMSSMKPDSKISPSERSAKESNKQAINPGEVGDLNKINELLTATVAAEMQRLQMHQMNLQLKLDMLKDGKKTNFDKTTNKVRGAKPGSFKDLRTPQNSIEKVVKETQSQFTSSHEEIMKPIDIGWKREIRIKYPGSVISSEVVYVNREGRKFRNSQDIAKYLDEADIRDLTGKNFSFNPRIQIGNYYEQKNNGWSKIHESEIENKLSLLDEKNEQQSASSTLNRIFEVAKGRRRSKSGKSHLNQNRMESTQMSTEESLLNKAENSMSSPASADLMQEKLQNKLLRQQERRKLERLEAERKEQQILEEREIQRQQALLFKQQEREQRKQHLNFLKALESKRRLEERDRRREEMKNEKIYIQRKRMEQRRLASKIARELKMPVEDMCLKNNKPLPELEPLQGIIKDSQDPNLWSQLDGNSTANVLMVLEFLHTFKDAILIDSSVIPTFEQFQRSLLNDPEHTGSLVQLTMALLHQCLCDPGVPAPGPWLHCMTGIKVTDVDVSKGNYSEILRLFLWARKGFKCEISITLETEPFLALKSSEKAGVLAFLVNELVCSRPVCSEIEKHLENLATLRRDKWIVEGKIRQARIEHANDSSDTSTNSPMKQRWRNKCGITDKEKENDEKDSVKEENDSLQDTNELKPTCRSDTAMQRRMKELTKEHQSFNEQLFLSSKPLRGLDMGQDRYKRRYWVLSNLGGIYVEGLESGRWLDDDDVCDDDAGSDTKVTFETKLTTKADAEPVQSEEKSDTGQLDTNGADCSQESIRQLPNMEQSEDEQPTAILNENKEELNDNPCHNNLEFKTGHYPDNIKDDVELGGNHLLEENGSCVKKDVMVLKQHREGLEHSPADDMQTSLSSHIDRGFSHIYSTGLDRNNGTSCSATNILSEHSHEVPFTPLSNIQIDSNENSDSNLTLYETQNKNQSKNENIKPSETKVQEINSKNLSEIEIKPDYSEANKTVTNVPVANIVPSLKMASSVEKTKTTGNGDLIVEEEDEVLAAAKAIAARAVASSTHLLFPQMAKNKLKLNQSSSEPQPINNKSKSKSQNPETESKTDVEIGEHTAVALLSMGINLGSLSEKQLEALSHSNREESEVKRQNVKHATVVTNGEKEPVAEPSSIPSNSWNKVESLKLHNPIIEDLPMDLSKPVPNLTNRDIKQNPSGAYLPHMPFNNSGKPASQLLEMSNFIISGMHYPLHLMERSGTPKSDEMRSDFMIPPGSFDPVVYTPQDVLENPLPIPKEMKYGWWRITDIKQFDSLVDNLHSRGSREKYLHRVAVKHRKFCIEAMELSSKPEFKFANGPMKAKESVGERDATQSADNTEIEKDCTTENDMLAADPEERDPIIEDILEHPVETAFQIEMETLKQVEELFDRCIAVGMLNTAWSDMPKASVTQTDLEHIPYIPDGDVTKHDASNPIEHDPRSVLSVTVDLLRKLEQTIPRCYLKPPLVRKGGATEFSNLPSLSESGATDVAAGLRTWRNAVATATSAAQISMSITMLETCIAWERTPRGATKVETSPKIKKRRTEKRSAIKAQLPGNSSLKKKKKSSIPDGGVQEISENSPTGSIADHFAEKQITLSPKRETLKRTAGELYLNSDPPDENRLSDAEPDKNGINDSDQGSGEGSVEATSEFQDGAVKKKKKKKKKKKVKNDEEGKEKKKRKKHTAVCREILQKLQTHELATWFLFPVDTKAVPEYRKIIKKPIDFSTIENRLKKGRYKTPEGFMNEILMVFDNCQLYNEDDSPIGRAGHTLRSFFDERWAELMPDQSDKEIES